MSPSTPKAFHRKFPRRSLQRKIGVLFGGSYFICDSGEIGEGGMSILSEFVLSENRDVVVNFQIPDGTFASLRGKVRSVVPGNGLVTHGISFDQVPLVFKRQIRAFVSARTFSDLLKKTSANAL
jgi:hypothetical protein